MTNILKTLNKYIKKSLDIEIYNDLFPSADIEGVIAIHDPATRNVNEYIDGTTEYEIAVSYSARYSNAKKGREILTKILDLLDGARLKDTDDKFLIKTKAGANVQFIATDDKNNSIYTASINAVYVSY